MRLDSFSRNITIYCLGHTSSSFPQRPLAERKFLSGTYETVTRNHHVHTCVLRVNAHVCIVLPSKIQLWPNLKASSQFHCSSWLHIMIRLAGDVRVWTTHFCKLDLWESLSELLHFCFVAKRHWHIQIRASSSLKPPMRPWHTALCVAVLGLLSLEVGQLHCIMGRLAWAELTAQSSPDRACGWQNVSFLFPTGLLFHNFTFTTFNGKPQWKLETFLLCDKTYMKKDLHAPSDISYWP